MTTSHLDPRGDSTSGGALLPIFTTAFLLAMIPIVVVVASDSVLAVVVALTVIVAFTGGLIALLGRMIGPDEH
jgi:VIT1/CCC1 family predicted Fe2+/Mn2+ transporter